MNNAAAAAMAGAAGLTVSGLLGFSVIPWLRRLNFGQTVIGVNPKPNQKSQYTPTMGGILIIAGTVFAVLLTVITDKLTGGDIVSSGSLVASDMYTKLISGIMMALALALVGFADDYIRIKQNSNLGLTVTQKSAAEFFVILAYMTSLYMGMQGEPFMFIPFAGVRRLGFFFWIFGMIYIFSSVNAVNITDGTDGLCAGTAAVSAVSLAVIAALRGMFGFSLAGAALSGACIGFLLWNKNPAKVFPGNTGSLFISGMIIALAYAVGCPLILLLSGIVYVVEGASDIIQIIYFRLSGGKTVFAMAPLHRHLELSGWSQKKIFGLFSAIGIAGCAAAVAVMYFGGIK